MDVYPQDGDDGDDDNSQDDRIWPKFGTIFYAGTCCDAALYCVSTYRVMDVYPQDGDDGDDDNSEDDRRLPKFWII